MRRLGPPLFATLLCFAMTMGAGNALAQSTPNVSPTDKQFVQEAAQGGAAEVELGTLATQKASSADVKQFGQRMVDDHSRANQQLKAIAQSKGIDVPAAPSAKDKAIAAKLEKLSGTQFDDAYMNLMVRDHKKDVTDFQKASKSATDPQIKEFAEQTLPTLQEHLQQAEKIAPQQSSMQMQDH